MSAFYKKFKNNSLLKYIAAFSAIVIILIIALGGYLFKQNYNTIHGDFVETNERYLSNVAARHEGDIKGLTNIAIQLGMSEATAKFSLKESPIKAIRLKEQLSLYRAVSQFFDQIYYINHDDAYLYNHATSIEVERFLYSGLRLTHTTPEEFRAVLFSQTPGIKLLAEQGIRGYAIERYGLHTVADQLLTIVMPIPPECTSSLAFLVKDDYYDELLGSAQDERRHSYILFEQNVVASRGGQQIPEAELAALANERGSAAVDIAGERYLMTVERADSGLTYVTAQSMRVLKEKIKSGLWGVSLMLLLMSVPAAFCIVALSYRLSGSMRRLHSLIKEDERDYYNFDKMEKGIRALVDSSREGEEAADALRKMHFTRQFVQSDFASAQEIIASARAAGLDIADKRYYAVVLMGERDSGNETRTHQLMLDEIKAREDIVGCGIHLISLNRSLFLLYFTDESKLNELLEHLLKLGQTHCENFVMAVSGCQHELTKGAQTYLEADAAYDHQFLRDNSSVIRFDELMEHNAERPPNDNYIKQLNNAIRLMNIREVERIISEICLSLKDCSLLTFRMLYNDIISMLLRGIKHNGEQARGVYNVFTLSQCYSITDFANMLREVCMMLIDAKDGVEQQADIYTEASEYMRANYADSALNMSALADQLGVNTVTLSVEFKNACGMNPSDYLALIRMESAKKLLRETCLKVRDISLKVGYEDDHVFMRRFKKYTGKTAMQYREEQLSADNAIF